MFNNSTQKKYWLLNDSELIATAQKNANQAFIEANERLLAEEGASPICEYLVYHEERRLQIHYTHFVYEVCRKFKPPVPMSVVGMSVMYFKRFFMNTSVMAFNPKYVAYLCVYLACKVDEYNVSIDQFMAQVVSTPQPQLQMFIIDNELLLLQKLDFHLTIHSPYRPLEGFVIDLKTNKEFSGVDIEQYRGNAEKFLANCLLTDVSLLYSPSQIAFAALSYSIGKSFNSYILELTGSESNAMKVLKKIEQIKEIAINFKAPNKDEIACIEEKLSICQDNENNPESELYHRREILRKEAKDLEKRKKFDELYEMQMKEEKVLAQDMSISS